MNFFIKKLNKSLKFHLIYYAVSHIFVVIMIHQRFLTYLKSISCLSYDLCIVHLSELNYPLNYFSRVTSFVFYNHLIQDNLKNALSKDSFSRKSQKKLVKSVKNLSREKSAHHQHQHQLKISISTGTQYKQKISY